MSGINPKSSHQNNRSSHQLIIIVIIVHEFHSDTSLKQNFRATVNVTY